LHGAVPGAWQERIDALDQTLGTPQETLEIFVHALKCRSARTAGTIEVRCTPARRVSAATR
jgi:hypothetical protein